MRKTGLTLEEHDRIGAELKQLDAQLIALTVKLTKAYPVNEVEKFLNPAHRKIGQLRSYLESRMFREWSDKASLNTYYGPRPRVIIED